MNLDQISTEDAVKVLKLQELVKATDQQLSIKHDPGSLSPEKRLQDAIKAFVTYDPATIEVVRSARMLCTQAQSKDKAVDYTKYNVLIQGDTGSGKSLLARILHGTVFGRFVEVNCAGLQDTLFESELYGHRKGSFTGAYADREGLLLSASRGTAFIDEVGELPLSQQAKLLHAVENKRCYPVGADRPVEFSCRMVFATNRPLEQMVKAGLFREDLYHRISTIILKLPPLAQRGRDVLAIAASKLDEEGWTPLDDEESTYLLENVGRLTGGVRQLFNWLARRELLSIPLTEAAV